MSKSIKRVINEYTRKYCGTTRIKDADIRGRILSAVEICKPLNNEL